MYPERVRTAALARLAAGAPLSLLSRELGISRSTLRSWREPATHERKRECPRCEDAPLAAASYVALLGYYLGDGCISERPGYAVFGCPATGPSRRSSTTWPTACAPCVPA